MGFASYYEDDMLRSSPLPLPLTPGKQLLPCPFCGERFDDQRSLNDHLSLKHVGERPILMVSGREPDQSSRFTQPLAAAQIGIKNSSTAYIEVNGLAKKEVSPHDVPKLLSQKTDANIKIQLANRFDNVASPVYQQYYFELRIPDKTSLDEVDLAFKEHLTHDEPSMQQVAAFLKDSRCHGVVRDYADALGSYVRAVLVKDQVTGVTLPPSEADSLYGKALDGLKDFTRPLAMVISAVVRFTFNDFSAVESRSGFRRLDWCNSMLAALLRNEAEASKVDPDKSSKILIRPPALHFGVEGVIPICPIDEATDHILDFFVQLGSSTRWETALREKCNKYANETTLTMSDRLKIYALWASTSLRLDVAADAIDPLRLLSSTYPFGEWATSCLEDIEEL